MMMWRKRSTCCSIKKNGEREKEKIIQFFKGFRKSNDNKSHFRMTLYITLKNEVYFLGGAV